MTKVMTPSTNTITQGQIGKLQDLLGAGLRKSDLLSDPSQKVIETQGEALVADMVAAFRKRVDAMSDIIVRQVKVDRSRSPQAVLEATGRKQYVTDEVVAAMPRGEGDEVDVYFFKLDRYVSDDELEKEYELRGLKPADPYSQAAVNEVDSVFADEHPNGTHWKGAKGKWCFASFRRWRGGRDVDVSRFDDGWSDYWFFAGVRK